MRGLGIKIAGCSMGGALVLAAGVFGAAAPVSAAPQTATQTVAENGVYFWVDALYERVKLTTYGLGIHNLPSPAVFDAGPTQSFNPRLDGGGVRAAIGYGIPGTATRLEFGGSYIDASATQSATAPTAPGLAGLLMTGAGRNGGFNCSVGASCATTSVLDTDYGAWSFNGKVETDWKFGATTLTPSIAVFGGNTRADQTLSQALTIFNAAGAPVGTASYSARTKLEWRDLGARAGLHVSSTITPSFIIGWGGSVGVAARSVKFSGNDVSTTSGNPATFIVGSSALTLDDSKTVVLANTEANVTFNLTQSMSVHGFAGLNYDGDVPGIAGPSYTGSIFPSPTSRNAAQLVYDNQTNFYVGGGLKVSFGGVR